MYSINDSINYSINDGNFMGLVKFRYMDEFQTYKESVAYKRLLVERLIAKDNVNNKKWNLIGFCEPCQRESRFLVDWQYSDGIIPNYRERLICEYCGLNSRQRFIAGLLKRFLNDSNKPIAQIHVLEQVTKFYKYIQENLNNANVVGSEYLGGHNMPGQVINGIRHEDATKLSFAKNSVDIIVSNDVYEHVHDIQKTLKEAYRVLTNNGKLLISIPFHYSEKKSKQRAAIVKEKLVHLLPALYHGNPSAEENSLVFYDFGWDFLDYCKEAGFNDSYVLGYYSLFYGYIGEGLQVGVIIAEKR
jgi:SAM-dependent methyltransferase